MPTMIPNAKPRLSAGELQAKLKPFAIDREKFPLVVIGMRGYYRDSMGAPGVNDRGIYDDAIFLDSPHATVAFNGNTDPSRTRKGTGLAEATKGMACLKPGAWFVHRFDVHAANKPSRHLALCQRAGVVTVLRDGVEHDYEDTGHFGVNIHKGGFNTTSSLGCQTIHPTQWPSFIALAEDQARRFLLARWKASVIPYVLMDT